MLSFRTNGNFIDFVNTDDTSLHVETVLMSLHNTSRAISWGFDEDTSRITFTINEIIYSNIPITSIDFDGMVMNSQDDFQTGIETMFTGYASSPGGSSNFESYQNSAMSAAVMAYVYRDENDNIFRVYEPTRNNDISRKVFAYADSIDKFRFDSADIFNSTLADVKLLNIPSGVKIQGCRLETMVIDGGNFTGLEFIDYNHKGLYGLGEVVKEILISGTGCKFKKSTVGAGTYFDQCGQDTLINNVEIGTENFFNLDAKTTNIQFGICNSNSEFFAFFNGGGMIDFYVGSSSNVFFGSLPFTGLFLEESVTLGGNGFSFKEISGLSVSANSTIKPVNNNLITLNFCHVGTSFLGSRAFTVIQDHDNCCLIDGHSTFNATLAIDGLTDIDLATVHFYGLITLTSANATETINQVSDPMPGFRVKFLPESGLTVTFDNSVGLTMPTASFIAVGTKNDWIEFETTADFVVRQVNAQNYL